MFLYLNSVTFLLKHEVSILISEHKSTKNIGEIPKNGYSF